MRIVCISDTHDNRVDVPDGDVLIHAGDFTMMGRGGEISKFRREIEALPHRHKIVIAGNHDLMFERGPERARVLLGEEVTYLQDSGVRIAGLEFWGSPWTPPFGHGWAFNGDMPTPEGRPDVLISHGPPRGVLDFVPRDARNAGSLKLAEWVAVHRPQLHVFGHIHEGYGQFQGVETLFVNACVCDVGYRPVNAPIVVDL